MHYASTLTLSNRAAPRQRQPGEWAALATFMSHSTACCTATTYHRRAGCSCCCSLSLSPDAYRTTFQCVRVCVCMHTQRYTIGTIFYDTNTVPISVHNLRPSPSALHVCAVSPPKSFHSCPPHSPISLFSYRFVFFYSPTSQASKRQQNKDKKAQSAPQYQQSTNGVSGEGDRTTA